MNKAEHIEQIRKIAKKVRASSEMYDQMLAHAEKEGTTEDFIVLVKVAGELLLKSIADAGMIIEVLVLAGPAVAEQKWRWCYQTQSNGEYEYTSPRLTCSGCSAGCLIALGPDDIYDPRPF